MSNLDHPHFTNWNPSICFLIDDNAMFMSKVSSIHSSHYLAFDHPLDQFVHIQDLILTVLPECEKCAYIVARKYRKNDSDLYFSNVTGDEAERVT